MNVPMEIEKLQETGVALTVELRLTLGQFRALLQHGLGYECSDEEVVAAWRVCNRRILPPDPGSFSGIGSDIGELVKDELLR